MQLKDLKSCPVCGEELTHDEEMEYIPYWGGDHKLLIKKRKRDGNKETAYLKCGYVKLKIQEVLNIR